MTTQLHFALWLLVHTSVVWIYGFFVFLTVSVLRPGRQLTEGLGYNLAKSSDPGDFFLSSCIAISATALQRHPTIPIWIGTWSWQIVWLLVAVLVGIQWEYSNLRRRKKVLPMDVYHNVFIAPLLLFFLGISFPIPFICQGTPCEKWGVILCFLIWVGLLFLDLNTEKEGGGILDQRAVLERKGLGNLRGGF